MNFERAFSIVVESEGGYVNDPNDPGGATRYGITEAVARANGYTGDMRTLPLETAKSIYQKDYWDACKCGEMPWPLSLYVFDCAVNQGVSPAKRLLQRALGTVQDEIIGAGTLRLARGSKPWHWARYMAFRAQRYQSTRNYDRFGEGWLTRIFMLAQEAGEK